MINIFKEYELQSVFGNIIKEVKNLKSNVFPYEEIKVLERKKSEKSNKNIEMEVENEDSNDDDISKDNKSEMNKNAQSGSNNIINNSSYKMVIDRNKLFSLPKSNNGYLSFNFINQSKYTDYGIELSRDEVEIMKKNNESENTTYNSNFLNFKKELENTDKKEINLELSEFCLPTKIEKTKTQIPIKCDILFYPIINKIDFMSKKIIIEEINPKDGIILIGYTSPLSDSLKSNNIKCINLTDSDKYTEIIKDNIIQFNYTSDDLYSGKKVIQFRIQKSLLNFTSSVYNLLYIN
jgi:hypothetical protein